MNDWPSTVVHAAGTNDFTALADLTVERLADTLRAKVLGARNLDALLRAAPPAHFVLFSSGAGVWGSAAQGAYAAANAFLDALAEARVRAGFPACSLAWGLWAGGGMASSDAIATLARRGVLALEPAFALDAFEQALAERSSTRTIAAFAWSQFADVYGAERERPLIRALVTPSTSTDVSPRDGEQSFADRLEASDPARRQALVLSLVLDGMASVLGVQAASVDPELPIKALGMDSLMAVQLRNRLADQTGLKLPPTLLFNYPTPLALARHLLGQLSTANGAGAFLGELARLQAIAPTTLSASELATATERLHALAAAWQLGIHLPPDPRPSADTHGDTNLSSVDDDEELFRLIDESITQQGLGHGNG